VNLPQVAGLSPKITAGGSFFLSSGTRPTNYFQPIAKLLVPVNKKLSGFVEWRYYDFNEPFFPFEDFHTHTITAGVRITR
jgi:hypothetical protein